MDGAAMALPEATSAEAPTTPRQVRNAQTAVRHSGRALDQGGLADKVLGMRELTETVEDLGNASVLIAAVSKRWPDRRVRIAWTVLAVWRAR